MDMLTVMNMTAMAAEFANQLKDPTFNELGFKERGLLINAEWNCRQSNKLNRFIRNARFAVDKITVFLSLKKITLGSAGWQNFCSAAEVPL